MALRLAPSFVEEPQNGLVSPPLQDALLSAPLHQAVGEGSKDGISKLEKDMLLAFEEQASAPPPSSLHSPRRSAEPSYPQIEQGGILHGGPEVPGDGSPLIHYDESKEEPQVQQQEREVAVEAMREEDNDDNNGEREQCREKWRHLNEVKELSSGIHHSESSDDSVDMNGHDDEDDQHPRPASSLPAERSQSHGALSSALESGGNTHLFSREDESARPTKRQSLLLSSHPSLEPSQEVMRSDSDGSSDDELNNTHAEVDEEEKRPRVVNKRKRPSSSHNHDDTVQKKRKYYLQQRCTGQLQPRCKPQRYRAEGRLPSPAPSAPQALDIEMPPNLYNVGGSSRNISLTLTEITFRPHSPHYCSFTVMIQIYRDKPELSFGQLARLIENIGHIGKIDDLTIKPMTQNSFLVTGFSLHTSSRLSRKGTIAGTAAEASHKHGDPTDVRLKHGKGVDVGATASEEVEPLNSDEDSVLSDSDSDPSSDDDSSSSEDELGRLSMRKNIP